MAGNLDKALLQMAGFEDEGDLYAKAGSNWFGSEDFQVGSTGKEYTRSRDLFDDAANWGFKNGDSRIHALLYAWAKDNPNEPITPEVIQRLDLLSRTADSIRVSGRSIGQVGAVKDNEKVKSLIKQMQTKPEEVNSIWEKEGFKKYDSPIQNYFDWANNFLGNGVFDKNGPFWINKNDTYDNAFGRNLNGNDFAKNLALASTNFLEDKVVPSLTDPNYDLSKEEIAKKSRLAEAKKKLEDEEAKKLQDAEDEENLRRAGYGFMFDPEFKNDKSIPDEWL